MAPRRKKQLKADLSKEAMYRKIMPSIPTPDIDEEDSLADPAQEEELAITGRPPYNLMEVVVRSKVPFIIDKLGACGCTQCKNDIIALSLNRLPPFYSGSKKEKAKELLQFVRRDYEVKIISAVIQAVQKISGNPRH